MKTPALTALLLIGALAPRPAVADEFAVDMNLSQGLTRLPVFILEAETPFGADLEGWLTWTVNGVKIDGTSSGRVSGRLFEVRAIPLLETSLVCAQFYGRLVLGGDLSLLVEERSCVVFVPSSGPIEGPVVDLRLHPQRRLPIARPSRLVDLRR